MVENDFFIPTDEIRIPMAKRNWGRILKHAHMHMIVKPP
jgi:hypothetical protein